MKMETTILGYIEFRVFKRYLPVRLLAPVIGGWASEQSKHITIQRFQDFQR